MSREEEYEEDHHGGRSLDRVCGARVCAVVYVVQDVKTKKCTVTETKPASTDVTVVNGDTVYKTKAEAESGMKTVKVCTSN